MNKEEGADEGEMVGEGKSDGGMLKGRHRLVKGARIVKSAACGTTQYHK
jgi:hypothetical protein